MTREDKLIVFTTLDRDNETVKELRELVEKGVVHVHLDPLVWAANQGIQINDWQETIIEWLWDR